MPDHQTLVDTDVWSALFMNQRNPPPHVDEWRQLLLGHSIFISPQTQAEVLFGATKANWGEKRMAMLRALLAKTPTVPLTERAIAAHAQIRAECSAQGHALAAKQHMGDAWVAAVAVANDLPLLAGDQIYRDVPGLRLL